MTINRNILRRPMAVLSALGVVFATAAPVVLSGTVSAVTNQVTSRSITLSDSTANATPVTYAMTITIPDASQSLVVDFCKDSPIIGGDCSVVTPLTGFTASGAGLSVTNPGTGNPAGSGGTPGTSPTGWTLDSAGISTIKIHNTTTPTTASTKYTFYFTGIHNPTANGTFYARVYTYTDASYGSNSYSNATAPGTYVDYGGFAMSIANNVTITAIVQETLTFCVSKSAPGPACGTSGTAVDTPALTLGSGTPKVLGLAGPYTDTAYTQLSTNALYGAVVSAKTVSSTTCAGLSRNGGTSCDIPNKNTAGTLTPGTANFGLQVAAGTGTVGSTAPTVGKYDGTTTSFYMGDAATNIFGDPIEASTSACQDVNAQLTYGATASATTPAGVYTTTQAMIATGTF